MNIRFLAAFGLTAALFWMTSCAGDEPGLEPIPEDGVVLAFGDSITHGTGAARGEDYPSRLARLIGRRVVESGVPGEVTAEGVRRLPGVLEEVGPALVILCEGGNDILQGIPEAEIAANLEEMTRAARAAGAQVVLVAVPHFSFGLRDLPLYEELGRRLRVPVLKGVLASILSQPRLKADMVHPNGEGYGVLAREVARFLRERGAIPQG